MEKPRKLFILHYDATSKAKNLNKRINTAVTLMHRSTIGPTFLVFSLIKGMKGIVGYHHCDYMKADMKAGKAAKNLKKIFKKDDHKVILMVGKWKDEKIIRLCKKMGVELSIQKINKIVCNPFYLIELTLPKKKAKKASITSL